MNLKELNSFKLSDAVTFHDKLNPKLWNGTKLRPEVREQLLKIAEDFLQELGVHDLDVKDITISGSNAAYSYTKHSDLDLHILVDMGNLPIDEVYRELFTAKKTIYNDTHDIKIHTIPVELYVQDSRQPVVSLGEYSVMNDQWIKIPTKRRSDFDQTATKSKYEKLLGLIEIALQSKKYSKVKHIIDTIKRYRQAGLDKGGEFGPENLAYKMLRSQGYITKLYDLRDKLHSEKLSFETMYQNIDEESNHWYDAGVKDAQRDAKQYPDRVVKKLNPRTRLKTMQDKQARHPEEVEQYSLGYRSLKQGAVEGKQRTNEKINPEILSRKFRKQKDLGWYRLEAQGDAIGRAVTDPPTLKVVAKLVDKSKPENQWIEIGDAEFFEAPKEGPYAINNTGDGGLIPEVSVHPEYQRKGIATEMYKFIRELGNDIVRPPSGSQSDDAVGLWGSFEKQPQGVAEDKENHNSKLDEILYKLCNIVKKEIKEKTGEHAVAACIIDPDNRIVAKTSKDKHGRWIHAEHNAIDTYEKKYGEVPEGSIIVTTLSPCNEYDDRTSDERFGESCTDYINSKGIKKVYCGYMDPTQDNYNREFNVIETSDNDLRRQCKQFADTFLKTNIDEAFDTPLPITWEKGMHGDVDALAKLPDGSNLSIMFNKQDNIKPDDKTWMIEFYRNNSQEVTGEGDAQKVFSTVLLAIQQFIKKYKPLKIYFSASKQIDPSINYGPDDVVPNPESRAKLYDRMVLRYAKSWGYKFFRADNGDLVMYQLSRIPKQKAVGEDYTMQFAAEKTPPVSPYAGVKDNQYRGGISEAVSPKYVTRVDMTPIKDFESGMKTYYGTDDWHQSGLEKKDNFTQEMKGLYAGEPHRTALYASGNASKTRFLELNDPKTGQPVVYFDKKDIPRIRNTKTYVSVFDASRFKKLPTGEYFSENPGKPLKQEEITDPFKYMTNNGWVVRVTDDIQKEFKKAQQLHKAGKIDHYGGENLTEASGYIPSKKEKNDPRFKTALTVDVHPDSIKKNAKAFYWNTSRAGIPPTAKANGKI